MCVQQQMEKTFLFFFGGPSFVKKGSKEKAGVESPVPTTHTHTHWKQYKKCSFLFHWRISHRNLCYLNSFLASFYPKLMSCFILTRVSSEWDFPAFFFIWLPRTLMTYPDSFLRAEQEKQQKKTARCWEFLLKCHAVKPCKGSISDNQQT